MKEKALLAVSFGTSHEDTRQKTIGAVEQALSDAFGGWQVEAAYTSPTIRRILAGRGQAVPSPEEAMEAMAAQGVRRLLVQPTHLICGEEYDKLCKAVWQREGLFERVQMGQPLLYDLEDYKAVAQAVCEALPVEPEEALVLMGHGTPQPMNAVYPALQYVFQSLGMGHVFLGTVEGWPDGPDVVARVQAAGYRKAALAPLMLVAGDHAKNDMAGPEPDSWKSLLEGAGLPVRCILQGLGELEAIQQMYVEHARRALAAWQD